MEAYLLAVLVPARRLFLFFCILIITYIRFMKSNLRDGIICVLLLIALFAIGGFIYWLASELAKPTI